MKKSPGRRGRSTTAVVLRAIDLAAVEDNRTDSRQTFDQILKDAIIDELIVRQVNLSHIGQLRFQFLNFLRFEQRQS